ncbi:hypothetical protein chiPu_0002191 [Chiloscyllium punctatum]|uniref:Uncharacterized protein n=1 Tax=Chiloscyllium punctatum TaxID=137246 RepID=A0A401S069_CHIPU|nr:hypothetical protein [Chiloscyllium punctatum]
MQIVLADVCDHVLWRICPCRGFPVPPSWALLHFAAGYIVAKKELQSSGGSAPSIPSAQRWEQQEEQELTLTVRRHLPLLL